jgi:3-hydroxyisobutyrate dehydrogenase-like beta-hydroxyacid dehydrogenase
MARRLLRHGFTVVSCAHRRREAIETLKAEGLVEVETPRAVAERVDILMTIVVDAQQTDRVLRGAEGALGALQAGSIIVVMSTVAPSYCQALAVEAARQSISLLDCPVSGGPMGAAQGTLALMIGGDIRVLERCRSALEALGTIFHCGNIGMGMVSKLANNSILIATLAAVREARAMARSYGMDMERFMEIIGNSTGNSRVIELWEPILKTWEHLYPLGRKDAALCLEVAQTNQVSMPMLQQTQALDWNALRLE